MNKFRIRLVQIDVLCIALYLLEESISGCSILLTHYLTCYTLPVLEMANVIIHGGTFNSAQGDFHINNLKDSGMYNFRSVQRCILINNPMKDFVT